MLYTKISNYYVIIIKINEVSRGELMQTGRLIVSINGTSINQLQKNVIQHPATAGIILFNNNYQAFATKQLYDFISQIQSIAINSGKAHGIPIFVDQEGGWVNRLDRGFTPFPPYAFFGEIYDKELKHSEKEAGKLAFELAFDSAYKQSKELLDYGILNLAPVLDLDRGNKIISLMKRSFHHNAEICYELANAYIDGMLAANMPATGKHFPGHGQNIGDSHVSEPIDLRSLKQIEQNDLIPFMRLIKQNKLKAIMPAHITYPEIDAKCTAGFSKIWIEQLLRDKYGFNGLVISDCLSMVGAGDDSLINKLMHVLETVDVAIFAEPEADAATTLAILEKLAETNKAYMNAQQQAKYNSWVDATLKQRQVMGNSYTNTNLQ